MSHWHWLEVLRSPTKHNVMSHPPPWRENHWRFKRQCNLFTYMTLTLSVVEGLRTGLGFVSKKHQQVQNKKYTLVRAFLGQVHSTLKILLVIVLQSELQPSLLQRHLATMQQTKRIPFPPFFSKRCLSLLLCLVHRCFPPSTESQGNFPTDVKPK